MDSPANGFGDSVMTSSQTKIEEMAEKFRREPYHLLCNNCLTKSIRFARECKRLGIDVKVIFCFGLVPAKLPGLSRRLNIPVPHAWAVINGERIELSHPLGYVGILSIRPEKVRPVVKLKF